MSGVAASTANAEHSRLVEARIHAFRNSAHTLVFAVCEGADVAHALSSAREQLAQLKLALTASAELGAAAANERQPLRCAACGWMMRFDAVQPGFESVAARRTGMAIDGDDGQIDDTEGNNREVVHEVCRRCGGGAAAAVNTIDNNRSV
jgi:ribosomal protein L37E